jgi:acetyltransferase-like isoleucine patch superfamily enzyme
VPPPRSWLRYLSRFLSLRGAWQAIRYPGLHLARGARLSVDGRLSFGEGCVAGAGTRIVVPRQAVLELGRECRIGRDVELNPGRMSIGDETSIQDRCVFQGDVSIGRNCIIAYQVFVSSGRHHFDLQPHEPIKDQDRFALGHPELAADSNRPVIIEDDCWLGVNSVVMPGVRVGKGAVVGANSVVTRDVAPYTVVAGVPAKRIRERLDFAPPRRLMHGEPAHLPYFYSGFAVTLASRSAHAGYGGLIAEGPSVLALDGRGGRFLCLSAKRAFGGPAVLTFGEQRAELGPQFHEVRFRLSDIEPGPAADRFALGVEPSDANWALESAWIDEA